MSSHAKIPSFSLLVVTALTFYGCDNHSSNSTASSSQEKTPINASITWHEHIAPLVSEKCGACHVRSGIAPFSVETYDDVAPRANAMLNAIEGGTMPPWGAIETDECQFPAPHKNDIRLSTEQKAVFRHWVNQGTPEGDVENAAPIPSPPVRDLLEPQRQLTMPSPIEITGHDDRFVCFRVEVDNPEKVWLTGSQIIPGNTTVAHHALIFSDPGNESAALAGEDGTYDCFGGPGVSQTNLVGVWAPGIGATTLPENTGMPLAANSALVVQMHYHPAHHDAGTEVDATTRIDLSWTTESPAYIGTTFLFGNIDTVNDPFWGGEGYGLVTGPDFVIPARAENHVEINRFKLPAPPEAEDLSILVWQATSHMHYVGKDMKITVNEGEASEQCLVQTPRWDYRWQQLYFYDRTIENMPTIKASDTITLRCTYNNSLSNPYVVQALQQQGLEQPIDVKLGDETLDEMCVGALGFAVPAEYAELLGL